MKSFEVAFCGSSVYLCGLAAGLQQVKQLRIRIVDVPIDKATTELKMLHPHVVITDDCNYTPELVSTLRQDNPQLLLVKIYPETDLLEIVVEEQRIISSVEELGTVIIEKMAGYDVPVISE